MSHLRVFYAAIFDFERSSNDGRTIAVPQFFFWFVSPFLFSFIWQSQKLCNANFTFREMTRGIERPCTKKKKKKRDCVSVHRVYKNTRESIYFNVFYIIFYTFFKILKIDKLNSRNRIFIFNEKSAVLFRQIWKYRKRNKNCIIIIILCPRNK